MRVHLLGLPHFPTTRDVSWCAYSQKVRKLATMLTSAGIETFLYGAVATDADLAFGHFVPTVTPDELDDWFGDRDWTTDVFNEFDPSLPWWQVSNARAVQFISERSEPGDILGITMGTSQQSVMEALSSLLPVEVGIGYSGVIPSTHKVFESWAWRNYITGKYGPTDDVRFFDTVIPNFFEPEDFPLGTGSGGYYLFLGRLTERKGPHIAALACERIGAKLVVAGQGHMDLPGDVEYVGVVGPERRAELMGDAIATFCPSTYLEPFCGVSVESQLCGTPVISTDWGALVENVPVAGRANTLSEFCDAAELIATGIFNRIEIRKRAVDRWSVQSIGPRYAEYLLRVEDLFGDGWYA